MKIPYRLDQLMLLKPEAITPCFNIQELERVNYGSYRALEATPEALVMPTIIDNRKRTLVPTAPNFMTGADVTFPTTSLGHDIYLSRLPNALCVNGGIVVDEKGNIFSESFRHLSRMRYRTGIEFKEDRGFAVLQPPLECQIVPGKVLFLDGEHFASFGHFLGEIITRLWVCSRLVLADFKIICGGIEKDYVMPLLEAFGIARDQIVFNPGALLCEDLWIASQSFIVRQSTSTAARAVWRTISDFYVKPPNWERVYVSRARVSLRKLANEKYVEALFESRGFKIIHPEELPIAEQVNIFGNATYVAGCSGSNMFNCVYAKSPQKRFFLTSPNYILHTDVLMTSDPPSSLAYFVGEAKDGNVHSEWSVSPGDLKAAVDNWLQ